MNRARAGVVAVVSLAGLALWFFFRAQPRAVAPSPSEPAASAVAVEPAALAPEPAPATPIARAAPGVKREANAPPFADEDDYLRTLERLGHSDKSRALELVEKGEGWYPGAGEKAQARRALGITLLVDLGNMAEARARTERFIVEYPDSRYRPLVQGVTGIHPRPTGPSRDVE